MRLPIPGDWDNETWCKWAVCWPDSEQWRGVLRGFLTLPQRGWTWDEKTGDLLSVIEIGREITSFNLPLEGCVMGCNDDNLADALNNIAIAISNSNNQSPQVACCGDASTAISNSIQNFVTQPVGGNPVPVYGTEQPVELPPDTFPPGYETLAEYDADKCRKANSLINGLIATLRALGAITTFNFTGLSVIVVMAIAGVLVVQPYLIPILVGGIIVLATAIHVLDDAADEIVNNKQEWVCTLYDGDNAEGIIANLADIIDTLVGVLAVTGVVGGAIKLIILILLNSDNINKLLTNAPMLGVTEIDCTACNWWSCVSGEVTDFTDNSVSLLSVQVAENQFVCSFSYPNVDELVDITADIAGWTPPTIEEDFVSAWDTRAELCGGGSGLDWQNLVGTLEPGPVTARTFLHRSNTSFTVTYTRIMP